MNIKNTKKDNVFEYIKFLLIIIFVGLCIYFNTSPEIFVLTAFLFIGFILYEIIKFNDEKKIRLQEIEEERQKLKIKYENEKRKIIQEHSEYIRSKKRMDKMVEVAKNAINN